MLERRMVFENGETSVMVVGSGRVHYIIFSLILLSIKLHVCCVQQNQNHHQDAARDAVTVVLLVVFLSRGTHSLTLYTSIRRLYGVLLEDLFMLQIVYCLYRGNNHHTPACSSSFTSDTLLES
jgi:hypothetical protein